MKKTIEIVKKKGYLSSKKQRPKLKCPICKSSKYRIVYTHGLKSPGYKVCSNCGGVWTNFFYYWLSPLLNNLREIFL